MIKFSNLNIENILMNSKLSLYKKPTPDDSTYYTNEKKGVYPYKKLIKINNEKST